MLNFLGGFRNQLIVVLAGFVLIELQNAYRLARLCLIERTVTLQLRPQELFKMPVIVFFLFLSLILHASVVLFVDQVPVVSE